MGAKYNSTWGFNIPNDMLPNDLEVWIDCFNGIKDSKANKKIFVAIEPNEITGINQDIIYLQNEFDFILTHDEAILDKTKNSVIFEHGTKWVEIEKYEYPTKKFSVSTVCGYKIQTRNHILRKELWYKQNKIKIPKNFYISQYGGVDKLSEENLTLGDSKFPLFDSMFHICIENTCRKYYFTEKIMDCILCKSVPIYVGCTNINEYFNTDGIITCNSVDEIIKKCNNLTEEDYYNRLNAIEENYLRAQKWIEFPERLVSTVKELYKI